MRILSRKLTIAALAAVAVGAFVGTGEAQRRPARASSSMLLIDDTNAIGVLGDGKLSLDEAIRLANGSLKPRQLDPQELAQVHGAPGRRSADRMLVVLPQDSTITAEHEVSPLHKNTRDVLDGNGVTLAGDGSGTALRISSSDFTLTNLTVQGFLAGLDIDPAGKSLRNITITGVEVGPTPLGGLMVGSTRSHGRLNGLAITDSVFDGGIVNLSDALNYLFNPSGTPTVELLTVGITAGRNLPDARVSNSSLENVLFARNKVINGFEGLYVMGGLVGQGGSVDHSVVRHVLVLDNEFTGVPDASLNAIGAEGIGSAAYNGVEDLTIAGNRVMAADWGIALWGGETFGDGDSHDNYVRNADIHDNFVTGQPGFSGTSDCIDLEGAWATLKPGGQSNSSISDVRVHDNWIDGQCSTGIKATAGVSFLATNTITSENSVYDVSIERNHVEGAATAMEIIGGFSPAAVGARSEGNSVYNFRVEENTFVGDGSGTAIHLAGGVSARATVTKNSVHDFTFTSNDVTGYAVLCLSEVDKGQGASGNSNTVVCPSS